MTSLMTPSGGARTVRGPGPLTDADSFVPRHIGPRPHDAEEMARYLGYESLDALIDAVVPENIRFRRPLALGRGRSEIEALRSFRQVAGRNQIFRSFIGLGYYACLTPPVIQRNILENPAWYTAYTPYQAEIAQGRLEALLNFQTMIIDLTGLPVANASLLDEGTAAAEAMAMCLHASEEPAGRVFFVSKDCHPQTIAVVRTRALPLGVEVLVGDPFQIAGKKLLGALVQYPDTKGAVKDWSRFAADVHAAGGLLVVAADPLALTLFKAPGEFGADVAVGSTQRFGVPLGCGGPHAAYLAVKEEFQRRIPGRIVGVSKDVHGKLALRLALQTREQHIRREKATSNVCTAQVLLANIASMYAVYHGPQGLKTIAKRVHRLTGLLVAGLRKLGLSQLQSTFFDTLKISVGGSQADLLRIALEQNINLNPGRGTLGIALDETTTPEIVESVWWAFGGELAYVDVEADTSDALPSALKRTSTFLTHPVFHLHRSET